MSQARTRSPILSPTVAVAAVLTSLGLVAASCSETATTVAPSHAAAVASNLDHASHGPFGLAAADEKGYIDGWFDGGDVQLYYTKSYFCAEPPASGAPSNCEIGAPPEIAPREGPIPTIYAIAAAGGIQPPPATVSCLAGTPCLNHPGMIDLSRIGGPAGAKPVSHSHILDRHAAGWFNTVNIRVFSLDAWNQIAAAKTLAKVRELQGGDPATGVPGVISADTPTNIYFFIAGFRPGND
jgi:hypothetical protein